MTVGHHAQGPTKGSSRNPYHSTGDKSAASAFPLLCLCSRSSPAQNAHCAHLSPQTLLFSHQLRHFLSDQHRLKCFFPTLKFHRAYCMYYSLTLIYSCICSLIFLTITCQELSQAVSFDNYYFMFLSYFYKQTVIY